MAYFEIKEELTKGKVKYAVRVREKNKHAPIPSKSKKFDNRQHAESWAIKTKLELENACSTGYRKPKVLNNTNILFSNVQEQPLTSSSTLFEYMEVYMEHQKTIPNPISKTGLGSLNIVKQHDLAMVPINEITFEDLQTFCMERLISCSPSTIAVDISSIMRLIREVATLKGINISDQVVRQYYSQLKRDGLIADSNVRTRRLEKGELFGILKKFFSYDKKTKIKNNYPAIVLLSIYTTLRISELMALTWDCIDFNNKEINIKKGKNTKRGSNNVPRKVPMQAIAANLLQKIKPQHATGDMLIFNIKAKSFSSIFPRVINAIGIVDLQLRDLRREGVSILLEKGLSVEQVALFTGHRDYKMIQNIYNQMRSENILRNNGMV